MDAASPAPRRCGRGRRPRRTVPFSRLACVGRLCPAAGRRSKRGAEAGRTRVVKITGVRIFKYWVHWRNWVFVRLETDEGLHGWGEASLHGSVEAVEAAVQELTRSLLGHDPAGVEAHWQRMYHAW